MLFTAGAVHELNCTWSNSTSYSYVYVPGCLHAHFPACLPRAFILRLRVDDVRAEYLELAIVDETRRGVRERVFWKRTSRIWVILMLIHRKRISSLPSSMRHAVAFGTKFSEKVAEVWGMSSGAQPPKNRDTGNSETNDKRDNYIDVRWRRYWTMCPQASMSLFHLKNAMR